MNKVLLPLVFSVLLLVPVGAQQVFADHPDLPCLPPGILITPGASVPLSLIRGTTYCFGAFRDFSCPPGYGFDIITGSSIEFCSAAPGSFPDPTLAAQCQGAAVLLSNHCFAEALASIIGGVIMDIDTTALLVASIGTDPVITGLVALTMAGVAGQTAWFIHRRKKQKLNL